jgi:ATP:ADP antiporter, AAA family
VSATGPATDRAARAAAIGAFAMIANQVGGKAVRDALFLSTFGVERLPAMLVAAALFSIVAVLLGSRVLTRWGPGRAAPVAFGISGVILLGIWPFARLSPPVASILLYLHLSIGGSILVSWFWSVVNERFDPRTARQRIARIAGGGTLGGVIGGLLAERAAAVESSPGTIVLPLLALLHLCCALALARVRTGGAPLPASSATDAGDGWQAGVRTIRRLKYLRLLAALVLVTTMSGALVDFVFKSQAAARFAGTGDLLRFFALFYTASSILTFAVQSTLSRRLLESAGLARTASLLPFTVGLGSVALLIPGAIGVWSTTVLRGGESILRSSVFRSSYELFYTPVSPRDKRAAKTLVDVGFDRLGDALGGGVIQLVLFATPLLLATGATGGSLFVLVALAAGLGVTGLLVAMRLERGYVDALERSLLERGVDIDAESVGDHTSRTVILRTVGGLDLTEALARIGTTAPATPSSPAPGRPVALPDDPVLWRIAELRSRDAERVRRALTEPLDSTAVPHVVRLLGWDDVAEPALRVLRTRCDRDIGQLTDALLDPDGDFVIRRRIPRVLAGARTARAVPGLVAGLDDARFEVRFHCGAALSSLAGRGIDLAVRHDRILAVVLREAAVDRRVWESRRRLLDRFPDDEQTPFVDEVLRKRSGRSLEHVFTLLSLVYPREPLQIAYRGLHTDDQGLRGTALEYLESILPPDVRANLWPLLEDRPRAATEERSRAEVLDALLKSHDSIRIHLEALREREGDGAED